MTWITLSLISAVLLGCYDITKKVSARGNAVPPILLISVTIGAALWAPLMVWSWIDPSGQPIRRLVLHPLSGGEHGLVLAKSCLVATSWTFGLFALKHLPLSIAAPIRSTSPVWTILIAILLLGERPTAPQWAGILTVLTGFWCFSLIGRREGFHFGRDRWVGCMLVATVTGAISGIYDKYLLQTLGMPVASLQAWFSIYLVPAMLPCFVWWWLGDRESNAFVWRWSIAWISPLLLAADLVYFIAVADRDALISVISVVRRCSVVVAFLYGVVVLGEKQVEVKAICIVVLLMGALALATFG